MSRGGEEIGLSTVLREETRLDHAEAERSGIVREIIEGRSSRHAYILYLRSLYPVYEALEAGLDRHRCSAVAGYVSMPEVRRCHALAADLASLAGSQWRTQLAECAAAKSYARQIANTARGDGAGLVAHAYVRYLGDLSGGQILRKLLSRSLGLGPEALSFYEFPQIPDIAAFKTRFRAALDCAGRQVDDWTPLVAAARSAFACNREISIAVNRGDDTEIAGANAVFA